MKERKEWAERQREDSEKRMAEIKARREREKQEQEAAKAKQANEAALIAEMLREMYKLNPEFAARRQDALQVRYVFFAHPLIDRAHFLAQSGTRTSSYAQSTSTYSIFLSHHDCFPLHNCIV
jgi:hypothetical protein